MNVAVSENLKTFHLAINKPDGTAEWSQVVGHEIVVGEHRFCAVGIPKGESFEINISEATTGFKVTTIKNNPIVHMMTATKEGTQTLYETFVADHLKRIVQLPKFESEMKRARESIAKTHGPMPGSVEIDDTIITAPLNENLS